MNAVPKRAARPDPLAIGLKAGSSQTQKEVGFAPDDKQAARYWANALLRGFRFVEIQHGTNPAAEFRKIEGLAQ